MSEILIAVMGATGSGKTTFINHASGAALQVGEGLRSCTSDVQVARPFQLDGRPVSLIDTPGFDDTTRSDVDILRTIGDYLSTTYKDGKRVSGIIYIHRISDIRMGGISRRNFKMFRELCGENTLVNVVIVTNMWEQISKELGEMREAELVTMDIFFKPTLDKGAKMLRHDPNTQESAHNILRHILNNHPLPLQIQQELVVEAKNIAETSAGVELGKELLEEAENYRRQMQEIQQKVQDAIKFKDEKHRIRMEMEAKQHEEQISELEAQSSQLESELESHRRDVERQVQETAEKLRWEAEQAAAEFARQAVEIQRQTQEAEEKARWEAEKIQQEIRQAEEQARSRHPLEDFRRQIDEGGKWFVGEIGRTFGWW